MVKRLQAFFKHDVANSALLLIATVLAIVCANTESLSGVYDAFVHLPVAFSVGSLGLDKSLQHWVNDGLMALFFLLIGLELKREFLQGELAKKEQLYLPTLAAIGGMLLPALLYTAFNYQDPIAIKGWAIPAATDIAFALGVLTLLKSRIPVALKLFLLTLAILDDLGAIIIIALFYTSHLSIYYLVLSAIILAMLMLINYLKISRLSPYLILGALLWVCVLQSGIHATLAGVVVAFCIPMNAKDKKRKLSPLKLLEVRLYSPVSCVILPLFAFVNAGISFKSMDLSDVFQPVSIGIILGLFLGKQLGVFTAVWLGVKCKLAKLPSGCNWLHIYGLSLLCGIGFTMSLFISSLAFKDTAIATSMHDRIGIILGSLLSAVAGYFVLRRIKKPHQAIPDMRLPSEK